MADLCLAAYSRTPKAFGTPAPRLGQSAKLPLPPRVSTTNGTMMLAALYLS